MVGPAGSSSDLRPGAAPGGGAVVPGSSFCPHCAADLTHLPPVARYCHRCGTALSAPFAACLPQSLILFAYGKALYNLGHRYETAVGSRRNLDEAMRCYGKAARLGDESARQRLASCEANAAALPTPPPLPPRNVPPPLPQ